MAVKHANRCRSCKFYDLPAVQNRAGAVMANTTARCMWSPGDLVGFEKMFPTSVRGHYNFHSMRRVVTNQDQTRMGPNDGADCSQWEPRDVR